MMPDVTVVHMKVLGANRCLMQVYTAVYIYLGDIIIAAIFSYKSPIVFLYNITTKIKILLCIIYE